MADLNNPLTRDQILRNLIQQQGPQKLSPTALQDFVAGLKKNSSIDIVRPSLKSVEDTPPATPSLPATPTP
jgi:hypothetical protein